MILFDNMRQGSGSGCRATVGLLAAYVPDVLNHSLQLNIISLLILAFGFGDHVQKEVASVEADLHAFANSTGSPLNPLLAAQHQGRNEADSPFSSALMLDMQQATKVYESLT